MNKWRVLKSRLALASLILVACAPAALSQQTERPGGATPPAAKKKNKKAGTPDGSTIPCSANMPTETFAVDFSGSVSNIGRTYEGPLCVEVFHNPIQQFVGLQTTTTTVAGPDLSKVVLGGSVAGGAPTPKVKAKKAAGLPNAVSQLVADAKALTAKLDARKQTYSSTSQSQDQAISDISLLRQTTMLLSGTDVIARVKSGYQGLESHLNSALTAAANFVPTDRIAQGEALLQTAQAQEELLNTLPLDYASGSQTTFECLGTDEQVGWSAWFAKCKDSVYTPLKAILDANLQAAQNLATDSDNTKALMKKVAIVQYWNVLFSTLGLRTNLISSDFATLDISAGFYTRTAVRCGILFNQTSNTTINIVAADLGPTLQGNDPTIKAQGAFVTVSCGTPFAVSAGVGFNTIEQRQFAIVQSPDGKGGVINTFGLTSDSKVTPTALVVLHVRLAEWNRHKYAFYGSLGVGGSLQNQNNSSPVQFLPGVSVSFWRTMFLTVGPDIGNQSNLTGGFKLGDTVPTGVTSINGLTKSSYTVGLGIAVTFTKP